MNGSIPKFQTKCTGEKSMKLTKRRSWSNRRMRAHLRHFIWMFPMWNMIQCQVNRADVLHYQVNEQIENWFEVNGCE